MNKPKLQLAPGDYVTSAFRAEIDKWMIDFFGYEDSDPTQVHPTPIVLNDSNLKVNNLKKKRNAKAKTLSDLLENINETFRLLEFDISDVTFYRMLQKEVIGLKKCSPLVIGKSLFSGMAGGNAVDVKNGLPAYFVIAVNSGSDNENSETLEPDFAFGMRVKKVPWNVTRMPGTPYLFGLAWRDGKKHIWHGFWVSVLPTGEVLVASELNDHWVTVGGNSYNKRTWETSSWHGPTESREMAVRSCFCDAFNAYIDRVNKWNVTVTNGKKKITFLIDDNHAKDYFDGRVKVTNKHGKTRPIIHFVKAHIQHHANKTIDIPEHIRGLRDFDWSGFHCSITAPKFHAYMSTALTLGGDFVPDDDLDNSLNLGIGELAELMGNLETVGQKKIARKKK